MKGKIAIVTGRNTGIGYGCTQAFCEAGMNVVILARREELGIKLRRRTWHSAAENIRSLSVM